MTRYTKSATDRMPASTIMALPAHQPRETWNQPQGGEKEQEHQQDHEDIPHSRSIPPQSGTREARPPPNTHAAGPRAPGISIATTVAESALRKGDDVGQTD